MERVTGKRLLEPPYSLTKSNILDFVNKGLLTPYDPIFGPPTIARCMSPKYGDLTALRKRHLSMIEKLASQTDDEECSHLWAEIWRLTEEIGRLARECEVREEDLNELLSSVYEVSEVEKLFESEQAPEHEPTAKRVDRKYTALTPKTKSRLKEIGPVIFHFCQALKARIQDECKSLAKADSDDWEAQALSLLEGGGKWDGIIIKDDIQKISFAQLAKSEHKERIKTELAQIILERGGYGRVTRESLKDFFK
ncbi:MAG TPA: hypothetical protein VEF34_12035 [Syntrophobacteraceae bacterium]|nr:hypothetical protein [Syntrophobacteraceae bacterium]